MRIIFLMALVTFSYQPLLRRVGVGVARCSHDGIFICCTLSALPDLMQIVPRTELSVLIPAFRLVADVATVHARGQNFVQPLAFMR